MRTLRRKIHPKNSKASVLIAEGSQGRGQELEQLQRFAGASPSVAGLPLPQAAIFSSGAASRSQTTFAVSEWETIFHKP